MVSRFESVRPAYNKYYFNRSILAWICNDCSAWTGLLNRFSVVYWISICFHFQSPECRFIHPFLARFLLFRTKSGKVLVFIYSCWLDFATFSCSFHIPPLSISPISPASYEATAFFTPISVLWSYHRSHTPSKRNENMLFMEIDTADNNHRFYLNWVCRVERSEQKPPQPSLHYLQIGCRALNQFPIGMPYAYLSIS